MLCWWEWNIIPASLRLLDVVRALGVWFSFLRMYSLLHTIQLIGCVTASACGRLSCSIKSMRFVQKVKASTSTATSNVPSVSSILRRSTVRPSKQWFPRQPCWGRWKIEKRDVVSRSRIPAADRLKAGTCQGLRVLLYLIRVQVTSHGRNVFLRHYRLIRLTLKTFSAIFDHSEIRPLIKEITLRQICINGRTDGQTDGQPET